MKYCGKVFPLDQYTTESVCKRREALGMTKEKLSLELGLSNAFVGLVESPSRQEKYNIHHLNKLAEILKYSISDFLPLPFMKDNT